MSTFHLIEPVVKKVPIIVSSPHSGTVFPDDLIEYYDQDLIQAPEDTDWFVHQLYDFVTEMGITMITAKYSRWVIDLNRDPNSQPLYNDGRIITELCPTKTFNGQPLYVDGYQIKKEEIDRRLEKYYWPYYQQIQKVLDQLKEEFGYVIFWDAHSIRQYVKTIQTDQFPDLILGDNDGKATINSLSGAVLEQLKRSGHQTNYNSPFKGGHLTRYFGKPELNQHALQLEMTKVNYMNDEELEYHPNRAGRMRETLNSVFEVMLETMGHSV